MNDANLAFSFGASGRNREKHSNRQQSRELEKAKRIHLREVGKRKMGGSGYVTDP